MMRTSATGPCNTRGLRATPEDSPGFTLVEILVVIVILAILATSVSLSLPDTARQTQVRTSEAWLAQLERAAELTLRQGRPHAWEVSEGQARLLRYDQDHWLPLAGPDGVPWTLPEGMHLDRLEVEGRTLGNQGRIIFAAGQSPRFLIDLGAGTLQWQIRGQPSGLIELQRQGAHQP